MQFMENETLLMIQTAIENSIRDTNIRVTQLNKSHPELNGVEFILHSYPYVMFTLHCESQGYVVSCFYCTGVHTLCSAFWLKELNLLNVEVYNFLYKDIGNKFNGRI